MSETDPRHRLLPVIANPSACRRIEYPQLKAISVRDPDGADEIQVSRADGAVFQRIRMREGDDFTFDDDGLLPFKPNQAPIDIVLFEVDENGPDAQEDRVGDDQRRRAGSWRAMRRLVRTGPTRAP